MRVFSFLFLLTIVATIVLTSSLFTSSAVVDAAKEVVLVQLLHRHGARTPIVPAAIAQQICGDIGCGELDHAGEMMLTALGDWLRRRYATQTATPAGADAVSADFTSAFGENERYSITHMYTRSTDVNRTLQSAASVIRGFAPNISTYYPIIHTVDTSTDLLLLSDNALSMTIPLATKNNACFNSQPKTSELEKMYLPIANLTKIADSLGISGSLPCHQLTPDSDVYMYGECILPIWDTIMSYIAMGRLDNSSLGVSDIARMEKYDASKRKCIFAETTPEQGAIMYNLVDMYINNMNIRATEGKQRGFGPRTKLLYEYSAHDTTIGPFMVALGYPELLLPEFGQVIITEMVNDTDSGELTLRHWYGKPRTNWPPLPPVVSTPDWYRYDNEMVELAVVCWDSATNSIKNTSNGGSCTVQEFADYAKNVLKPTNPAGAGCFLDTAMLKNIDCDGAAAPSPDNHPYCYQYRKACPRYACPDGFTVNTDTLECLPTRFVPVVSSGQAFAIASGTTIGGIVLGIASTFIVKALLGGKHL